MFATSVKAALAFASAACILATSSAAPRTAASTLVTDDACLAGGADCAFNAIQREIATHDKSEGLNQDDSEYLLNKSNCVNYVGTRFPCSGPGKSGCCGNACVGEGGVCCTNNVGYQFPCGAGSTCCGNACAAPGSKCCNKGPLNPGYEYPVSEGTKCQDELSVRCENRHGTTFWCGLGSTCGGDICIGHEGVWCQNSGGHDFACAKDNTCCGNACASAQSKCCTNSHGYKFPLTKETIVSKNTVCDSSLLQQESATRDDAEELIMDDSEQLLNKSNCVNYAGTRFPCAGPGKSGCCGNACVAEGGVCCTNNVDYQFPCGAGSTCCGNACAAPGSKCCNKGPLNPGYEYPVSEGTKCQDKLSVRCENRHGTTFWCGLGSTCGGDICIGHEGVWCQNSGGHDFACAKDNTCCGNACASAQSKCCTNPQGYKFPLTKETAVSKHTKCV